MGESLMLIHDVIEVLGDALGALRIIMDNALRISLVVLLIGTTLAHPLADDIVSEQQNGGAPISRGVEHLIQAAQNKVTAQSALASCAGDTRGDQKCNHDETHPCAPRSAKQARHSGNSLISSHGAEVTTTTTERLHARPTNRPGASASGPQLNGSKARPATTTSISNAPPPTSARQRLASSSAILTAMWHSVQPTTVSCTSARRNGMRA